MKLPESRYGFQPAARTGRGRRTSFRVAVITVAAVIIGAIVWQRSAIVDWISPTEPDQASLEELWEAQMYADILSRTDEILEESPLNGRALTFGGFAQFYISTEVYTLEEKLPYIDSSIALLRKALLFAPESSHGPIEYVLGKAYHFKGRYYADLTIEYLERAIEKEYLGEDTYEYLGLAHSNLGRYRTSAEFFQKAVDVDPTDMRFLALARAHINAGNIVDAEAFLIRTVSQTEDSIIEQRSRYLLGGIYSDLNQAAKAEVQYRAIIEANPRAADAFYYLGEIYAGEDKPIEARAYWREALSIDPNHYGARLRYYK